MLKLAMTPNRTQRMFQSGRFNKMLSGLVRSYSKKNYSSRILRPLVLDGQAMLNTVFVKLRNSITELICAKQLWSPINYRAIGTKVIRNHPDRNTR